MTKLYAVLLAGAALAPLSALAQTATPQSLPKVEIVAPTESDAAASATLNYTPVPASTFSDAAVATSDVADVLASVPGVSLRSGGGVSDLPIIHGFDDIRNSISVGGMAINAACPNHMNPALSYLDPNNAGSATVITSDVPVSLGGDSIGGAIIVEPKSPVFATPANAKPAAAGSPLLALGGSVTASYRTNNQSVSLSGTAYAATEHWSLDWAGSYSQGNDYAAGGGAKVLSTNYEAINNSLTLGYKGEGQQITVRGSYQDIPYEAFPAQAMDMLYNRAPSVNVADKGHFAWGDLDANAFYQHTQHYMNFLADKNLGDFGINADATPTTGMPMYTDGQSFGYSVKATIPTSKIDTVRIGNEFRGETLNDWWAPVPGMAPMMGPNTFENINGGSRDRIGTYAEWERQWSAQWMTLFGVRNDDVWSNTGDVQGYSMMYGADAAAFNAMNHAKTYIDFDATALARYTPNEDSSYEFGYTRKTRAPSLYELYTWSTMPMAAAMNNFYGDNNGYVGNLNLVPEVAHTVSFTADWKDARENTWELKVNPYYSYVQNYIDAQVIGQSMMDASYVLQYVNTNAELYGFDVSGHYQIAKTPTSGIFDLSGSFSYVRGINLDPVPVPAMYANNGGATSSNLYGIMPLNAKVALNQKLNLGDGKWTNTVELQAVSPKDFVDTARFEIPTPGYALVNLRSSYEFKSYKFDVGVDNLFDHLYYLPNGGVNNDAANFTMLPPPNWTNVPGVGRTIYAGLTAKF